MRRTVNFGSFLKFRRVVKCYNWASNVAVGSLLYEDVLGDKISYECGGSSLTVARIVASLTLK